ncbi:hypothetical protein [Bradyrhizobium sp. Rc2d]|uniref:hypothetical protein n=1 Tax=Bradyrhizobium sp. Rc2d TaxID=1855321 RepID=UPI000B88C62E|nr:hypothetical protein [Bradyrhizobium sp. Rc2d]
MIASIDLEKDVRLREFSLRIRKSKVGKTLPEPVIPRASAGSKRTFNIASQATKLSLRLREMT